MSTHNPLNDYNSYSYHHFIIVADTTERAETIADNPEEFFQFIRNETATPGLAVLVNPMSKNNLIVQDISWANIMNSDSGVSTHSNAINAHTDGKMTVLEPLGVRFFNRLFDIYKGFGVSSGGMSAVWVIKTVFVGYRNVGQEGQPEYISNLKPMLVFPLEMTAEFSEAGGRYEIQFVEANNGAGSTRLSNSTALPGGSVNLGGPKGTTETVTLQTALHSLQVAIETNYEQNYQLMAKAQANANNLTMQQNIPSKMAYSIRLHDMLLDSTFVMEASNQYSAGGNGKVPTISIPPSERLDQTIDRILKLCPKVMALAKTGDASGIKWLPNIITQTQTLDPTQNNGVSSRNTFYVIMRKILTQYDPTAGAEKTVEVQTAQGTDTKVVDNADANNTSAQASAIKQDSIDASNYLEFDYTYTGKNVDVLTYDMRMNMATGFFQMLISPQGVVKTGQIPAIDGANVGASSCTFGAPGNKAAMPNVAIANNGTSANSSNTAGVSTYEDIYKKWVQTENVAVRMKIRGNPSLMDNLTLTSADMERALSDESLSNGIAGSWLNGPIVVKVNVRMPVENEPNVYENFWYDGFYRVLGVKNSFTSGEFTQELEMLGLTDDSYKPVDEVQVARPKGKMPASEDVTAFAATAEPTGDRIQISRLEISPIGRQMIRTFESFAAKKYKDNDKFAIGYGHNLTPTEQTTGIINLASGQVIINNGITMEQADELMSRDILNIAENPIHKKVAVSLYQHEYDVLCSMVYNLGPGGVLGSDSTLLRLLNQQQYTQIPAQILRWNQWRQGGQMVVNSGLDQRRHLEAQHWGTGV